MVPKFLILLYSIFFVFSIHAQNTNGISYFNNKGYLTYEDSAMYYRQESTTKNYFHSYYKKNNKLYFEGAILNAKDTIDVNNIYNGKCIWYYPSGKIKQIVIYNEIGNKNGLQEDFYENGNIFRQTVFENNKSKEYIEFNKSNTNSYKVFEENFNDNSNNWPLLKTEFISSKIKLAGLQLTNYTKSNYLLTIPYKIDSINYSIETKLNLRFSPLNCKNGLVFGFIDSLNYNYFYVINSRYCIGCVKNGDDLKQIENYYTFNLYQNDWNSLKVTCINDSLYYFINDKLETFCKKTNIDGDHIGFAINNGASFYDNLIIKQYNNLTKQMLNTANYIDINGYKDELRYVQSGVMLNSNGLVFTSIKEFSLVNNFIIEALVNDTLKTFFGDVVIEDKINNYIVLKIRTASESQFAKPFYSYSYMNTIENQKTFNVRHLLKNKSQGSYEQNIIFGENKNLNKNRNSKDSLYNNNLLLGAPIFDSKGNMLGVISDINKEQKIKTSFTQWLMTTKLVNKQLDQIQKKELEDYTNFDKEIYKNCVTIKIF